MFVKIECNIHNDDEDSVIDASVGYDDNSRNNDDELAEYSQNVVCYAFI